MTTSPLAVEMSVDSVLELMPSADVPTHELLTS